MAQEVENQQDEELTGSEDIRADLEAAFESVETTSEETQPVESTVEVEPKQEAAKVEAQESEKSAEARTDRVRNPKGQFAPKTETQPVAEVKPGDVQVGAQAEPQPWEKAPTSWKPAIREQWQQLPPSVKEEIYRRERDTQISLKRAAETQKVVEPLVRAIQPYAQGMVQRGMRPDQVISNMLHTEQALSNPDERVRAQVLAQALGQYRVSVQALAAALDGTAPTQQSQQAQPAYNPQQILQQAKEEMRRELAQSRMTEATYTAKDELDQFSPQADFLDDVRLEVADMLESAAKRGVALSLKEAYDRACWANPEVRKILEQREASKQAATGTKATQRARNAASSVRSNPGGSTRSGDVGDDMRSALESAYDKHSR